jgi:hypothetical protein
MTQKQARHALAAIANRGDLVAQTNRAQHGAPVTVWLNSVGKAFSGRPQLDDSGLVVIDGGRAYIRPKSRPNPRKNLAPTSGKNRRHEAVNLIFLASLHVFLLFLQEHNNL